MKNITKYALALLLVNCSLLIEVHAQVAINEDNANPNASAMLDVSSTDKGLLIPRMTSDQRTMIANPETGLLVFDSTTNSFWFYKDEWIEIEASGDNLGNHTATQNIALFDNFISNDGENEGIQIDDEGKVGIGLNPTEHLSVKAGGNGIETLDANNTTAENLYDDPGATWQSYTALNDGILSRVELEFRDGSGTRTVSIYEGEGTAGNLRGTVTTDVTASGIYFASFDLSTNQIEQLAGEVYSIAIDSKDRLFVEGNNPYDGGREQGGG